MRCPATWTAEVSFFFCISARAKGKEGKNPLWTVRAPGRTGSNHRPRTAAVVSVRPQIGVPSATGANDLNAKVHGHASLIKMYATHMCNGCTIYKIQLDWCNRHSCTSTVMHEAWLKYKSFNCLKTLSIICPPHRKKSVLRSLGRKAIRNAGLRDDIINRRYTIRV
ncbi:hypothetical protein EVAR_29124_1 [Eumeta japonica]|uniref:Uncharacterized protein n=1 Tax=Eumeta variegata TaxID=151549 RepID=A0A4C1VA85_EUMVA|nr:hypothetical protein EVAR_29124_1 [Eumeta japonica]